MYTIRHTYATEQYIIGTSIVELQNLNAGDRMVMNVYLGHTDAINKSC